MRPQQKIQSVSVSLKHQILCRQTSKKPSAIVVIVFVFLFLPLQMKHRAAAVLSVM